MIEINLIPDVKYQLLKARRTRTTVISASILVLLAALGVVVLLAIYVFVIQTVASSLTDRSIDSEYKKLSSVKDLSKTLTIQNQLSELSSLQDNKLLTSRLFDVLAVIVPPTDNKNTVSISTLKLDTDEGTVTMEAEAANGYEALEVFKKTIAQTNFSYKQEGQDDFTSVKLASDLVDGERSYGQNSRGDRVLRFTLTFSYAPELFKTSSKAGKIIGPDKQIATDSANGVPTSLFVDGAGGTN
jgi:hypothetical protein